MTSKSISAWAGRKVLLGFCCVALLASCGGAQNPPVEVPRATFISSLEAKVPSDVRFSAKSALAGSPEGTTFSWDFGDGSSLEGPWLVEHRYESAGNYLVKMTVTTPEGGSATHSQLITIKNDPPVAQISSKGFWGEAPLLVLFSGMNSHDLRSGGRKLPTEGLLATGEVVSYQWDFGDGTTEFGDLVSHIYERPGRYDVTLTVTDDGGLTDTAATYVEVVEYFTMEGVISMPSDIDNFSVLNVVLLDASGDTKGGTSVAIDTRVDGRYAYKIDQVLAGQYYILAVLNHDLLDTINEGLPCVLFPSTGDLLSVTENIFELNFSFEPGASISFPLGEYDCSMDSSAHNSVRQIFQRR